MAVGRGDNSSRLGYGIAVLVLAALTGALAGGVFLASRLAPTGAPEDRDLYVRLAWVCVAGLGITLVLLVWTLARLAGRAVGSRSKPKPTEYVDAWKLSGQRMKLPEDPQDHNEGEHDEEA
jgi:hypothetical protein